MIMNKSLVQNLQLLGLGVTVDSLERNLSNPEFQHLGFMQLLDVAISEELDAKVNKQRTSLLRRAKLSHTHACIDGIIYHQERGLQKEFIDRLATGKFMEDHRNLCIYGASGIGKTYLGKAFGVRACELGFRTQYIGFPALIRELRRLEKLDSVKYEKRLRYYSRIPVLIIDEWLLDAKKSGTSHIVLELMDARYGETPTIFCSQIAPDGWPMIVDLKALGESILGRATSNSFTLQLKGKDLRKHLPVEKP